MEKIDKIFVKITEHKVFWIIFVLSLIFSILLSIYYKSVFVTPLLASFFGAASAFLFNYMASFIHKHRAESSILFENQYKMEKIKKYVDSISALYNKIKESGKKEYLFSGVIALNIEHDSLMFLLKKNGKAKNVLESTLSVKAGYDNLLTIITLRNKLVEKDSNVGFSALDQVMFDGLTESLESELNKFPEEIDNSLKMLSKYIKQRGL